jgi:hypothetical protein
MVRTHPSTPQERAQWTAYMLAHRGEYGAITHLSRASGVSRPTLYAWRNVAEHALSAANTPAAPPLALTPSVERQVLTLWVAHSSERDIQQCFQTLTAQGISLTTIVAILAEAERRALHWLATHAPSSVRALALDEIYANDRRGAYLNVVDVHSGAVWASLGPVAVDTESWILVLWDLQAHGVRWDRLVMDGGAAARAACRSVCPLISLQGDQWHILHSCAQLQARLDRQVHEMRERSAVVVRQAARLAAGQRPKGRNPQTDVAAHAASITRTQRVAQAVRYLRQELCRLVDVVVVDRRGVLSEAQRQADLECLLALVDEVAESAEAPQQAIVRQMQALLTETLGDLTRFSRLWPRSCPQMPRHCWRGPGCGGASCAGAVRTCWRPSQKSGALRRAFCWRPGTTRCGYRARWSAGIPSCARIWPSIGGCRAGCWLCWRSGIIIACSVVASIRARVRCI